MDVRIKLCIRILLLIQQNVYLKKYTVSFNLMAAMHNFCLKINKFICKLAFLKLFSAKYLYLSIKINFISLRLHLKIDINKFYRNYFLII